ncbi:MAG: ABC transporter ATP-binding protein [Spirochaetota bacterium]
MDTLLDVQDLATSFFTRDGEVQAVRGISLRVERGQSVGLVGESGCGKSVSMLSLLGLLEDAGRVKRGRIVFQGRDLRRVSERELERVRGREIAMIFQDPMTSLNPVFKVGEQLTEHIRKHEKIGKQAARARAVDMLERVGIPNAADRIDQYPIEFSGGMRQRVMIAIALIAGPKLIIADEPTTALDVTIQAQILEIMKSVNAESNTGIILITHDLGIVADICDVVNVMYGGLIVERGPVNAIYGDPRHPYTRGLLASVPNPETETHERLVPIPGQPPDLFSPPAGCPFAVRCPHVMKVCMDRMPPYFPVADGHEAACWLEHELARKGAPA